ncbi:MAG: radical SAM protein [Candidatus Tectomicrobia bacterium]|uniref:Radical SAM protein n=1 Tax=Tectimicrobiota bacterium TaxID=2528274 RepID=A0A933GL66_UNCTE|nr:radical SAM protein [Candidatus Tectomicrobia bacterium]
MKGNQKIKFLMIDESRGCPNACHFCIHPIKSGNRWRLLDVSKIIDLMDRLGHKLGTTAFRLAGSNTPARLRNDLAGEIIKQGLKVKYVGYGHARDAGADDYELLRKSGCASLFYGVESGSQEILDEDINKHVKVEQIAQALKEAKKAGLLTVASLIVPCPHDTPETLKQTLDLLVDANPDSVVMSLPGVIPGTAWYANSGKFGFKLNEDYIERVMVYKIRLLLPLALWEPTPYQISGKTHYESIAMAQWLAMELEKKGIITGMEDYLLLAANYLNISRKEVRDRSRKLFFTGDYAGIESLVNVFNERVATV